ncbi:hypothetical protein R3W88_008072 [Solanum pinnatisectum]|uniref:Amino acid transporter transmembrane domain-containing protein n=1 Tax=Solanum pinnatisectum TaxID=50273 RepID=A0AAV9M6Y3_9SOLN|nr:hypothetical protein R3W88_008072 [Solanum pinnatisectum]
MDFDPTIIIYPDIGDRAFGTSGRILVSIFMTLELYLVATGFLILAGDNLHNLLPDVNFEFLGLEIGGKQSFVLIVALVILPTVLLKNMSILAYVSASAVLASLVIIGNAPMLLFATITYASIAAMGYSMFDSEVESQITLNLPTGNFSSKLAIYTTLINPIAKYSLMMTPVINRLEEHFQSNNNKESSFSPAIRITLVISSVIVALTIPFFGYLMSLVGAFLSVTTLVYVCAT